MKKIIAPKTYHYEELGTPDQAQQKNLWIVCHGYGHLVQYFKSKFEGLDLNKNYLVFPEAGNYYYLQGFTGKVGANWMTSHERLDAIEDINNYLDQLHKSLSADQFKSVYLLGFSQGAYSIFRWVLDRSPLHHRLVLWGAGIAEDYLQRYQKIKDNLPLHLVLGDDDKFIPPTKKKMALEYYQKIKLAPTVIHYEGGHDIYPDVLKKLAEDLEK